MWRSIIRVFVCPSATAASTNWRDFRSSVIPRTMRAIVSHSTAPMAAKISHSDLPNASVSRITKIVNGSEYTMSTKRIISASVLPPAIPETIPYDTPISIATAVARSPTAYEILPP